MHFAEEFLSDGVPFSACEPDRADRPHRVADEGTWTGLDITWADNDAPFIRQTIEERSARIARSVPARKEAEKVRETLSLSGNSPRLGVRARRERGGRSNAAARLLARELATAVGLKRQFPALLPRKPYCANWLPDRLNIYPSSIALQMRHVQLNRPHTYQWMIFDIDRPNARYAFEEADLPPPNVIMVNLKNGHAHAAYLMATPVARHTARTAAREAPLRFFAAVERGIARRVGADMSYGGLLAKNPLHPDWYVVWPRDAPYELHELNDYLTEEDRRPEKSIRRTFGAGRNVFVFDELRESAYSRVRQFKKEAASFDAWYSDCLARATKLNCGFANPMRNSEVKGIGKSVAKWTWRRFSLAEFSARQSRCGSRPWRKRVPDSIAMPWKELGISRATYYRRKKAAKVSRAVRDLAASTLTASSPRALGEVDLSANRAESALPQRVCGSEASRVPKSLGAPLSVSAGATLSACTHTRTAGGAAHQT